MKGAWDNRGNPTRLNPEPFKQLEMISILKVGAYMAVVFCATLGVFVVVYYIHGRMTKKISVSEFRSRLKKLLK
jgi:energy-converting hydrogenase Eha subunit C